MSRAVRLRAVVGLALAQLRRSPGRTALTVLAVTIAVLSVTLLASLGVGVVETGEDGLDNANRDIWISNDPVDPGASGTENPIADSHGLTAEITQRDDVRSASPIAMHEMYVGTDEESVERHPAVGVHETHDGFTFEDGGGFERDDEEIAAAVDSRPEEPTTGEIVIDPEIAAEHDIGVGDTIYLGASRETATDTEFTVIGISDYYSQFLGSPAMTVPLLDLQTVAGTAETDRATFVTADVTDDADRETVQTAIDEEYPEYDVRTSDGQIGAVLEDRPVVIASGFTLVALAVIGGVVLTANLFVLVTAQQRQQLAALRALGLSRLVIAGTIGVQGLVVGLAGGLVGLLATPPITYGLNRLAGSTIGFDGLLVTPPAVYAAGVALAVGVGTVVAVITGWRASRYARLKHLGR